MSLWIIAIGAALYFGLIAPALDKRERKWEREKLIAELKEALKKETTR